MDSEIVELMNRHIQRDGVDPFSFDDLVIPKNKNWKAEQLTTRLQMIRKLNRKF